MVQPCIAADLVEALDAARLGIDRTKDDSADSCVDQGTSAHDARFKRDVHRAVEQAPMAHHGGRVAQREHFGVRCRVACELALVVTGSDHRTVTHHNCADRHIVVSLGGSRFGERDVHRLDIGELV